jgi:KaiC/GvpD/RAD55 family RecA-like ATPase
MEKIISSDVPSGVVILVVGEMGTLKSIFVHQMVSNYLARTDEFGVYLTLEESKESHLRNVESVGIKTPSTLELFDFSDIRKEFQEEETTLEMRKITEDVIQFYREKKGSNFTCFALDSLNALYSLLDTPNLRRETYHFFSLLRNLGLTSFIIAEMSPGPQPSGAEFFISDGVIELGVAESHEGVKRYIQIKKMKAIRHRMEKYEVKVGKEGISILDNVIYI